MRYEVGDKVVIKDGKNFKGVDYSNQIATILRIRECAIEGFEDYEIDLAEHWALVDSSINHEATAKLNEVKAKQLLKSGMIVEFRCGERMLTIVGENMPTAVYGEQDICFVTNNGFMNGSAYDDYLKLIYRDCEFEDYDVVAIYQPNVYFIDKMITDCNDSNTNLATPNHTTRTKSNQNDIARIVG